MNKRIFILFSVVFMFMMVTACQDSAETSSEESSELETEATEDADTIKVGVLASLTGALEAYGEQTKQGFELGMEYATDGTMEVAGKEIEVIYEDTETKPEVAVQKAT